MDEVFFTTGKPKESDGKKMKRGAGSQRKSKVLMLVQSEGSHCTPKNGQKSRVPGYVRMIQVSDTK